MRARLFFAVVAIVAASASAAPVAMADGVERARPAHRSPPRARPARPAPAPVAPPSPVPVTLERERVSLSDGFFSGSLTGGVGYAYGAGGAPAVSWGGGFAPAHPTPRFSGLAGRSF